MAPLEWWRGEKYLYSRKDATKPIFCAHIKGVLRIPRGECKPRSRPRPKRTKRSDNNGDGQTGALVKRKVVYDGFEERKNFTDNLLVSMITGVDMITAEAEGETPPITGQKRRFGELDFDESLSSPPRKRLRFERKNFTDNLLVSMITAEKQAEGETPPITGQKRRFGELDFDESLSSPPRKRLRFVPPLTPAQDTSVSTQLQKSSQIDRRKSSVFGGPYSDYEVPIEVSWSEPVLYRIQC